MIELFYELKQNAVIQDKLSFTLGCSFLHGLSHKNMFPFL